MNFKKILTLNVCKKTFMIIDFRYFLIKKITTYRIFLYNFQAFHLCEKKSKHSYCSKRTYIQKNTHKDHLIIQ